MDRASTLKHRTPLRSNRPIRRQSAKHRSRKDRWHRLKAQVIVDQIEAFDFAACEDCPKRFWTVESALAGLDAHHVVFRSQGGTNTRGNLGLLCPSCHERRHGLKVVEDLPLDEGGFDDDAYWEAVRLAASDHEAWEAMGEDEGGFDRGTDN